MTDWVVADLQLKASLQSLTVRDVRFGLDSDPPSLPRPARHLRVPCPQVALDRERHLGPPSQRWMKSGPEPLEQGQLSAIADRIARRIRPNAEVQPNDCAPGPELGDGHSVQIPSFESRELLMRCTRGRRDIPKTQARPHSRNSVLVADAPERVSSTSSAAIVRSFSRSHALDHQRLPFAEGQPLLGPPAGPTGGWGTESGPIRGARPLLGPPAGPTGGWGTESGPTCGARPLLGPPAGPTGGWGTESGPMCGARPLLGPPAGPTGGWGTNHGLARAGRRVSDE